MSTEDSPQYVRGDSVLIELTIEKHIPHSDSSLNDPENGVTISIRDPKGDLVVTTQPMLRSSTGLYYYIWQSANTDEVGWYSTIISVDGASYDGRYVRNGEFELVKTL